MGEPLEFVGDFVIREITGSSQDVIVLRGRALPLRPYTLEGTQRVDTTWYGGNPVGSQQVQGAQEMPTTINGKWSNRYIGDATLEFAAVNGVTITTVRELTQIVDDIRVRGSEVLVQWLHLSRRGILKRFKQTWHNANDLEWEMEFEWNSRTVDDISNLGTREFDMSSFAGEIADEVTNLSRTGSSFIERLGEVNDAVNEAIAAMEKGLHDLNEAITSYLDGASSSMDAARRAISLVDVFLAESDDVIFKLYQFTDGMASGVVDPDLLAKIRLGETIRSARITRESVSACRRIRHVAARARADIIKKLNPDIVSAFTARTRTDLREVSTLFYGTPNRWHALQSFNDFPSSLVETGAVVLVPRDPNVGGC